jgi:hypothetical protein
MGEGEFFNRLYPLSLERCFVLDVVGATLLTEQVEAQMRGDLDTCWVTNGRTSPVIPTGCLPRAELCP